MSYKTTVNRSVMPALGEISPLLLVEPSRFYLDNNINTYVITENEIEFTRIDIVFNAGSIHQSKSLQAECTLQLLLEGTNSLTSNEIANIIDFHGAFIDTNLTKDTASLTIYSLNKHLEKLIPLLKEIITKPIFSENELSNYLNRKKHQFKTNVSKVKFKAMLEFNKLVFGKKTPYGRSKSLDDYDNINTQDLETFFKERYNLNDCYILLSGNVTDKTKQILNDHIGSINIDDFSNKEKDLITEYKHIPISTYIQKEGSLQSALRIGRTTISKNHDDYGSLVVLNTVLGGYFGSRLMSNLREDKGYTYGVNSHIVNYNYSGYLCIATEVNAIHTDAALTQIKNEINKLRNELIEDSELQLVKNYIYGTYLRSFDGSISKTDRFRAVKDLGLNFEFYRKSLDNMMLQSPKQLIKTANKHLQFDDMIKLVVGKLNNNSFSD